MFLFFLDMTLTWHHFYLQVSTIKRPPKPLPRTRAPPPPPPPKEKPPVAEKPGVTGNPPVPPERPPKPAAPVAPLVGQRHNVVLIVLTVNLPLIPFYCFRLKLKGPNPNPPPDQPSDHWPSPLYDSTPRLRYLAMRVSPSSWWCWRSFWLHYVCFFFVSCVRIINRWIVRTLRSFKTSFSLARCVCYFSNMNVEVHNN